MARHDSTNGTRSKPLWLKLSCVRWHVCCRNDKVLLPGLSAADGSAFDCACPGSSVILLCANDSLRMFTRAIQGLAKFNSNGVKLAAGEDPSVVLAEMFSDALKLRSSELFEEDFFKFSLILEIEILLGILLLLLLHSFALLLVIGSFETTARDSNEDDRSEETEIAFEHCEGEGRSQSKLRETFNSVSLGANQNSGGRLRSLLLDKSTSFSSAC